jgi:HK97 family phage major capsid protein
MSYEQILSALDAQAAQFEAQHTKTAARLDEMARLVDEVALKSARPGGMGASATPAPVQTWIDTKTKARVPVLRPSDSMAALEAKTDKAPSMGRVLRGLVLGSAADDARELEDERKALSIGSDTGGGYTVSGTLSSQWIDLLRAEMVLSRAGALTVPMDSATLTLARLTADPTVSWHAENAALDAVEPTFGAMTLTARTVVCLVRLSLELSQDSANIEDMLQRSIVGAMANAIDAAGLVGTTPAPGGVFGLSGRNTVTGVGAPTSWDFVVDGMYELLADNVSMDSIGAMVAHPALWKKLRKLKTGIASDLTSLVPPPEVAALPKLWTTAAPLASGTTAKAVIGNWSDLLFGVRKAITVKVLTEAFMGSNLQVAVLAYARVDFGATRQQSFCTLEGITVA